MSYRHCLSESYSVLFHLHEENHWEQYHFQNQLYYFYQIQLMKEWELYINVKILWCKFII